MNFFSQKKQKDRILPRFSVSLYEKESLLKGFTPLEITNSESNYNNNTKSFSRGKFLTGFTLIELMITIFVIAIGLIGIMTLVQNTLQSASAVRLNLTAAYLAQEGIELTKNIRDTNWVQLENWDTGLMGCSMGCQIDYESNVLVPYDEEGFLNIDDDGFYNYGLGEKSKFKRKITINQVDEYLEVESRVIWESQQEENFIRVIDYLYDWR